MPLHAAVFWVAALAVFVPIVFKNQIIHYFCPSGEIDATCLVFREMAARLDAAIGFVSCITSLIIAAAVGLTPRVLSVFAVCPLLLYLYSKAHISRPCLTFGLITSACISPPFTRFLWYIPPSPLYPSVTHAYVDAPRIS
jgi:hypothetical protein